MNTDLTMLAASSVLTALLVAPYGLYMWSHWPIRAILGNRECVPELPAWALRAKRAQQNMLENFPHFAALVLVTNFAGLANSQTALGAMIFFCGRLVHAVVYVVGAWPLRAPAYFVAFGGEGLILFHLIAAAHPI